MKFLGLYVIVRGSEFLSYRLSYHILSSLILSPAFQSVPFISPTQFPSPEIVDRIYSLLSLAQYLSKISSGGY